MQFLLSSKVKRTREQTIQDVWGRDDNEGEESTARSQNEVQEVCPQSGGGAGLQFLSEIEVGKLEKQNGFPSKTASFNLV